LQHLFSSPRSQPRRTPTRQVPRCWRSSRPAASSTTICSRSRQCAGSALGTAAQTGGYVFAATTDWDALNDASLRDIRVVIWLNDAPHTAAQRLAFERYMAGGGGWLGFHVSGFGTSAWPWFTEFMGGVRFSGNNCSWTPSPRTNPDVKVLLTLDASNFPLGVKNTLNGGDIPVAWINTKYRMVYVNYGHGDQIYSAPPLPTMIDNILRWLLAR
jgi:hypothetical protein